MTFSKPNFPAHRSSGPRFSRTRNDRPDSQHYSDRSDRGSNSNSYGNYSAPKKTQSTIVPVISAREFLKQEFQQKPRNKTVSRFQDRSEYRHGGSYTLKKAWHGGGQGGRGGFGRNAGGRGGNRRRNGRGEDIDTSRFIKKASGMKQVVITLTHGSFAEFGLSAQVEKNLTDKGILVPSPIQDQAIPHVRAGRDLIGLANTGTGKTAAFLLPLIEKISADPLNQSALIIAPTRELALQIEQEFHNFARGMKLYSAICVGGMPAYSQIQTLRRNPHVVIGTPGRIQDLADRGFLNYKIYNNVVLDEVDQMLDMGFVDPITTILNALPTPRQSLFFSATMPDRIRVLTERFLTDPVTVEIQSGKTTDNVDQDVVRVNHPQEKFPTLLSLLKQPEMLKVLIFSETKRDVEKLKDNLRLEGINVNSIHGDKTQRERQRALNFFKDGTIQVLVATDVAARGIDVKDVTHVINYTVPQTHDDYVHRIGRTGRGNKKGIALTFVS